MFFIVLLLTIWQKNLRPSFLNEELWFFSQITQPEALTLSSIIYLFIYFVCNQILINLFLKHYQFI